MAILSVFIKFLIVKGEQSMFFPLSAQDNLRC